MKNLLVVSACLVPTLLMANNLVFGEPLFSGPGCTGNSVSYALSPNNNSLSVLFNQFSLTANSSTGTVKTFCGMSVKVTTQHPTIVGADYRGFHDLPAADSTSNRRVTYTLDHHVSQNQLDIVSGADTNNYVHSHQANITCAGTRVLKIFVDSFLRSPSSTQDATYSLDSIDLSEANAPNIALQLCNSGSSMISSVAALVTAMSLFLGL